MFRKCFLGLATLVLLTLAVLSDASPASSKPLAACGAGYTCLGSAVYDIPVGYGGQRTCVRNDGYCEPTGPQTTKVCADLGTCGVDPNPYVMGSCGIMDPVNRK